MMSRNKNTGWRYGCCRRVYKTIMPDGVEHEEVLYEIVEVFPDPFGYTAEAVTISSDDSKMGLVEWLRRAAEDIEDNEIIRDPDVVIHDMRDNVK